MLNRDERQNEGIKKWKLTKGRATCLYPTGFGKTRVALKTLQRVHERNKDKGVTCIVIVPTENLQTQWQSLLEEWELDKITTVYVVNTAIKRDLTCDLLIVDEVHMMVADTFSAIFTRIKYKHILCLTGTIDRLDGKQTLLNQYAPICDQITLDEAIENEWVADYTQYRVMLDVDLTEYKKQHTKFLHYFSFFNFDFNAAMKCATDYQYRIIYAKRLGKEVKNVMIAAMGFMKAMKARKSFIYDHTDKIRVANKIINARTDKKIITFTKSVAHAEQICCGEIYHGKISKKKKAKMLEEFSDKENGVINSCQALNVGADVPGVDCVIIISGDSSSITKRQRIGRSIRKEGDKVAEVWQLVIKGTVEEEWYRKSSTNLKTITIDESQLDEFLEHGTIQHKKHKETKFLFRF